MPMSKAQTPATVIEAPLIEVRAMSVDLAGKTVLHDVNFALAPGEIVTLVGPNGSGKTTFLRALIGAAPPNRGQITPRPGLVVGYVPQRLEIDSTLPLTVGRFMALPHRRPAAAIADALARAGLPDMAGRQMTTLSGGQAQRVLLARALLANPHVLILDEPTQGLDQPGEAAFYRLIEDVRREMGCAVVMASHDLHVVMGASDRVICLNGHICCEGAPTVVSAAPEYRALFGLGTRGALALYRHEHDHSHDNSDGGHEGHGHGHGGDHPHSGHAHSGPDAPR